MIRILLADDHPLTRSGLAAWIEKEEGMELVALAEDGEAAWEALQELRPDLALLDIEMPGENTNRSSVLIKVEDARIQPSCPSPFLHQSKLPITAQISAAKNKRRNMLFFIMGLVS